MKENPFINVPLPVKKKPHAFGIKDAAKAAVIAAALSACGPGKPVEPPKEKLKTAEPLAEGKAVTVALEKTVAVKSLDRPAEAVIKKEIESVEKVYYLLDWKTEDPEFFEFHENGEYSAAERPHHIRRLPHGEKVFVDAGLVFYQVEKGDSIFSIRARLAQYEEFKYLIKQKRKLKSFNIPGRSLAPMMWLPVPLENKDRVLSDEKFVEYCRGAIVELKQHRRYGRFVEEILKQTGETELLATMLAVAKKEAGGAPLGQFEFHRWEPRHKVFSFSLFHVLMKGPGLQARRNLGMTEGQLYHPKNSVKLFVAFVFEKMGADKLSDEDLTDKVGELFPVNEHARNFSRFYNGKLFWKTDYDKELLRLRNESLKTVENIER